MWFITGGMRKCMFAMSTKMFEKVLGQIGIEKQIIGVKKRATAERWEIQVLRVLRWQSFDKILREVFRINM